MQDWQTWQTRQHLENVQNFVEVMTFLNGDVVSKRDAWSRKASDSSIAHQRRRALKPTVGTTGCHAFGDLVRPVPMMAGIDELGIHVLQVVVVQHLKHSRPWNYSGNDD